MAKAVFTENLNAPLIFVDGLNGVFKNDNDIVRVVFYQSNSEHSEISETPQVKNRNVIAGTLVMHKDVLKKLAAVLSVAVKEM